MNLYTGNVTYIDVNDKEQEKIIPNILANSFSMALSLIEHKALQPKERFGDTDIKSIKQIIVSKN